MKNKPTERQHYVPRTYLKHFSYERNDNYFIHTLKTDEFYGDKVQKSNIINICVQKNAYTLPGEFPMLLEGIYGNIETEYSKIYELLTAPLKSTLTEIERGLIIATVVTMLFRNTKMPNTINRMMNEIVEMGHRAHKKVGANLNIGGETFSYKEKSVKEIQKEIENRGKHVIAIKQLDFAMKLIKYRTANDMIMVLRLDEELSTFITSDNPVSCINDKVPFLAPFDPTNTLVLPLDSKHALLLIPKPEKNERLTIFKINETGEEAFRQMITINRLQHRHAERFLLGTDEALKRYIFVYNNVEALVAQYQA